MRHFKIMGCATLLAAAGLASAEMAVSGYFNGIVTKGNDKPQDVTFFTVVDPSVAGLVNGTTSFYSVAIPGIRNNPSYASGIATNRLEYLQESNIGMQVNIDVNEDFEVVAQWVGTEGLSGEFAVKTEWAFAKYRKGNFSVRAGRMRTPLYMISEPLRVGYAYQWIRPPEEVYSLLPNELNNHNGVELSYTNNFRDLGYSFKMYSGQTGFNTTTALGTVTGTVKNIYGFEALLEVSDYIKLRYGHARGIANISDPVTTAMQTVMGYLNTAGLSQAGNDSNIIGGDTNHQSGFNNIGFELRYKKFFASGEVARLLFKYTGTSKSYYVNGGFDLTDKMAVSFTYGRYDTKQDELISTIAQRFRSTYGSTALAPRNAGGDALADLYEASGIKHNRRIGVDMRYFAYEAVALKAGWSRSTPLHGSSGLNFVRPIGNHINYYSLGINLVF